MSKSNTLKSTTDSYGRDQIACSGLRAFRATRAYDAVQGLSDLFNIHVQNDDVQEFDVRWDQALLPASETPAEMVLEGLYKSELFSFRLYWLGTTKKLYETTGNQVIRV